MPKPWKCEKCGNGPFSGIVLHTALREGWHFTSFKGWAEECTGTLIPYDRRRAPDALVQAATRLLHACERADEDGDLPECVDGSLFDDLRAALAPAPDHPSGEEGQEKEKR